MSENTMVLQSENIDTGATNVFKSILEGDIIGIVSTEECLSCFNCNGNAQISSVLGRCTNCNMDVKLTACDCKSTATVYLRTKDGQKHKISFLQKELNIITEGVPGVSLSQKLWNVGL